MNTPFENAISSLTEGRWQVITFTEFGEVIAGTFATEDEADVLAYEMADDGYVSVLSDSTVNYKSSPGALYDWMNERAGGSDSS